MTVSMAIDCFETPITVRRTNQATTFVNGRAQIPTDVDTFQVIHVSVQPMQARERQVLPELIRDRELLKMYTKTLLQSVDVEGKVRADRLTYNDHEYVVQSIEDWFAHGGYYKVVAVKEND
jgi:hypothetical protein